MINILLLFLLIMNPGNPVDSHEDYIFDARQARVGQTAAGMTIQDLDVQPINESDYWAVVKFKGETTVCGEIVFIDDNESGEGWGLLNHFTPSSHCAAKIPVTDVGKQRNGFSLTDNPARQLESLKLNGKRYQITLIIDDYEIYQTGKAQENKARLIKVVDAVKLD